MSQKQNDPSSENTLLREMRIPIFVFVGAIIIALIVLALSSGTGSSEQSHTAASTGTLISAKLFKQLRTTYDKRANATLGPASAAVTIREFGDFQCPACGAFEPIAEHIRTTYANNKNVRYVFYDFPLNIHAHAHEAAYAARCAGKQGAFWPYHDKLYATQRQWAEKSDAGAFQSFLDIAVEAGIKVPPFEQCLKTQATKEIVKKSRDVGLKVGIMSTPTILVNRQVFAGAQSYDKLNEVIQQQLTNLTNNSTPDKQKPAD